MTFAERFLHGGPLRFTTSETFQKPKGTGVYQLAGFVDPSPLVEMLTPLFPTTWESSGYLLNPLPDCLRDAVREVLTPKITGEWYRAKLISVKPGGIIHMHADPRPDGAPVTTRYHVVLRTNPYCWNYHDGDMQQLIIGGVYAIDELLEHASVNWGRDPRIHLVIDTDLTVKRSESSPSAF